MKYLLIILLLVSCCPPKKSISPIKKDTSTGHWEYYDGEDMRWIKDSTKNR